MAAILMPMTRPLLYGFVGRALLQGEPARGFLVGVAAGHALEIIPQPLAAWHTHPICLAGLPTTSAWSGTLRVTTAPAPTKQCAPVWSRRRSSRWRPGWRPS